MPPTDVNYWDSGSDIIYGNGDRDVIFGGGGENDTLVGNHGSDFLFGDFADVAFNQFAPEGNLFGILSMESLNCSENVGINDMFGNDGDGKLCSRLSYYFITDSARFSSGCESSLISITVRYSHRRSR